MDTRLLTNESKYIPVQATPEITRYRSMCGMQRTQTMEDKPERLEGNDGIYTIPHKVPEFKSTSIIDSDP